MTRGLEIRVLDGVNARSLVGFGWESFAWVRCTGFANGGLPMGSILGSTETFSHDDASSKQPCLCKRSVRRGSGAQSTDDPGA